MNKLPLKVIKKIAILSLVCGLVVFLLTMHFDIGRLLEAGGIVAIGAIVFAETGLLIGFFLPGDTLLFAAGFFAAQGKISLAGSILAVVIGAILGNMAGYELGRRSGPKLFTKKDALLLNPKNINQAHAFYQKHGGKTILLARFVPVVRTLAPLIAGMGKMNYKLFMLYNASGAVIWGAGITLIGYYIGKKTGQLINIDTFILPIILLATVATFGVSFAHILKDKKQRAILKTRTKTYFITFFKN